MSAIGTGTIGSGTIGAPGVLGPQPDTITATATLPLASCPILPALIHAVSHVDSLVPAGDAHVETPMRIVRRSARVGTIIAIDEKKPRFVLGSRRSMAARRRYW